MEAPTESTYVLGMGAVTALGATAAVAHAALGAALSRITLEPEDGDDAELVHVARVATLPKRAPSRMAAELAYKVTAEALSRVTQVGAAPLRLGIWLASDEPEVERVLGVILREVPFFRAAAFVRVGQGGADALRAVEHAMAAISGRSIDGALVVAVSSRLNEAKLETLRRQGRVASPLNPWGLVPGEGAAAVLLGGAAAGTHLGAPSIARIIASASGVDIPNAAGATLGRGLTDVAQRVLAALPPGGRAGRIHINLNGERGRADEWGFTIPRVHATLVDPDAIDVPSTAWGDLECVDGLLLLQAAARRGVVFGEQAPQLVLTLSDGLERAATLVEPLVAPRRALRRSSRGAAWVHALDHSLMAELADEAVFRCDQQAYLRDQLVKADGSDWRAVADAEAAFERALLALELGGDPGLMAALARLEEGMPTGVHVATSLLLETGDAPKARSVIEAQPPGSPNLAAATRALAARRGAAAQPVVLLELLGRGGPLATAALTVAAAHAATFDRATLLAAAPKIEPAALPSFIEALAEVGTAADLPWAGNHFAQGAPDVRRAAVLFEARIAGAPAAPRIFWLAGQDERVMPYAALAIDVVHAKPLYDLATSKSGPSACLALGMLGATRASWLLDRLGDHEDAPFAALALELVYGGRPLETVTRETENGPTTVVRLSRNRDVWDARVQQVRSQVDGRLRLRGGQPASASANLSLLAGPGLPPVVRDLLATELRVRYGVRFAANADAQVRWQERAIRDAMTAAAASELAPGSWAPANRLG